MHHAAIEEAPAPASEPIVAKTKYIGLTILKTASEFPPNRLPAIRLFVRVEAITPPIEAIAGGSAFLKV
ncbi:MAG: hypothetical protein J6A76_05875, partial [Oscillospiraceae bacterium]|nr:hypothetical protein [Oscillospiraceae bacterium]